ncbi:hypothetical protein B296_00033466, partial [Ensete ventricosum]
MWPPWVNTTRSSGAACRSPSFSSPTLKDLHAILHDEPGQIPSSHSLRRILHRACLASAALRAIRSAASAPSSDPLDRRRRGVFVFYYTSLRVVRRTFE